MSTSSLSEESDEDEDLSADLTLILMGVTTFSRFSTVLSTVAPMQKGQIYTLIEKIFEDYFQLEILPAALFS